MIQYINTKSKDQVQVIVDTNSSPKSSQLIHAAETEHRDKFMSIYNQFNLTSSSNLAFRILGS